VGYSTAPLASFGEALAAVAGALTGLLFVALSVNSDALAASRSLRARATQTRRCRQLWLFLVRQPASPHALGNQSKPARASAAGRCLGRRPLGL